MSLQVSQKVGEGGFEGVVVFPEGEIGDVIFPDFDGQIFARVGVEAGPFLDLHEAAQEDGKQLLAFLTELAMMHSSKEEEEEWRAAGRQPSELSRSV